jgi:hypothetical protein
LRKIGRDEIAHGLAARETTGRGGEDQRGFVEWIHCLIAKMKRKPKSATRMTADFAD